MWIWCLHLFTQETSFAHYHLPVTEYLFYYCLVMFVKCCFCFFFPLQRVSFMHAGWSCECVNWRVIFFQWGGECCCGQDSLALISEGTGKLMNLILPSLILCVLTFDTSELLWKQSPEQAASSVHFAQALGNTQAIKTAGSWLMTVEM